MMTWGRKKAFPTTSSASSISSFSLDTWLSRFKKMKDGAKPMSPIDDGFYWRISFDKERCVDEVVLENSDYRLNVSPVSSRSFKKMVSDGRKTSEFGGERRFERITRKGKVGSPVEKLEDCRKSTFDNSRTRRSKSNSELHTIVEGYAIEDSNEWRKLKNMKINEIMLRKQRKSVDVSKETRKKRSKQRRKVNAFSPRIRALEDMKRTRMKMNREKAVKDAFRTGLDSFAVVKRSFDPQRDFRDSMIEMIIENGIRQRDELEELLACYLTLNCDEYHHLIIKVFQQVWVELNHFDPYSQF
ncbi:hypothetical protein L6452_35618 [Arctium lappa]|uniref:Uncharacterized protein n=1 Tax=Arctium lappa TaxID=4217 RepID=A0ACB8Y7M5_ARCLA|nr:hypothetical protein L6452_35618 [Arctium lappa]